MRQILFTMSKAALLSAVSALPVYATVSAVKQDEKVIEFNIKKVSLADLPPEVFGSSANATSEQSVVSKPDLILDGSKLVIGHPGMAPDVDLNVHKLVLRNGATIVTNGAQLSIKADYVESDRGSIVSYESLDLEPTSIPAGAIGRAGNTGGRVIIDADLQGHGVVTVELRGQNGQNGGAGRPGQAGAPGAPGDHAADHLFDCAHGGGIGGRGERGQDGESGARGGKGGNGGTLVLRGRAAFEADQILLSAEGGLGGEGGPGGPGGPGGVGGPGGSGSTYCSGGAAGPAGPAGNFGPHGASGEPGTHGGLIARTGS